MTFDKEYASLYRRVYEFHKRHGGARTDGELEKMALDETPHCAKNPDFSAALIWAAMDDVKRVNGKDGD